MVQAGRVVDVLMCSPEPPSEMFLLSELLGMLTPSGIAFVEHHLPNITHFSGWLIASEWSQVEYKGLTISASVFSPQSFWKCWLRLS